MPDSVDNEASAAASNEGQPELRRRRDRRRSEGDAWTGTMPIITPNDSDAPASTSAPLQSRSWAEAAAAADASAAMVAGSEDAAREDSAGGDSARGDSAVGDASREEPRRIPTAAAPAAADVTPAASRAGRAAAANAPISDFISSPGSFVREQKPRPIGGFRGMLYKLTGGAWNLGPSAKQREEDDLARRISRQLQGSYNTAVLSLKGGIGKTSTTVGVGLTLAEFRGDPPCAIDANPDSGDLVERALGEGIYQKATPRTITDLLKNVDNVDSLTALARYMHHAGRLHLIAGEQDPEVSDSLTAEEYLRIRELISGYYSIALTDCGTGVTHNAMSGILQSADNLIIAAGYAVSGAKRARSTLQWLAGHGYEELARNAIVVITDKDEVSSRVDKNAIEEHLSGICRQLIAVPHDRGVADGDLVTLDVLRPDTRRAYKEIAAAIVDGYV
ncbi:MinD/ParA family ATP-binding protein [Arthrobacter bambusae]|uniref:MinD/ParA family ATP-binding protein n=1 Tax=Arthrobacter bambusae TaxID=1338426 RepID=UPI00277D2B3F|nr:MinD/ParA family protein [Arthrobacter bambusae]MDQ0031482.1 MinD-like ATPase involved in chromosome partitioning or flagellar assembly [Arthrobacter bambusae]MDQ0099630.1 MinD-like ATPase involved in chromosome partitioning or flagellar assembly [Arthrobacter bambusae]